MTNARILLLTVTRRERDAVLEVIGPATGRVTRPSADDTLLELGTVRATDLAIVQCARRGCDERTTAADGIKHWQPDVIIVTGTCCGLREDASPPQRLAEVVVATRVHDLDDRIPYAVDRDTVRRMRAGSSYFDAAGVHFGPMLASAMLLDSPEHRERLKGEHGEALGYEMAARGIYAAAADARVRWAVVKGISDWGVDRDVYYAGDAAARNAAAFVLHALDVRAFDARSG